MAFPSRMKLGSFLMMQPDTLWLSLLTGAGPALLPAAISHRSATLPRCLVPHPPGPPALLHHTARTDQRRRTSPPGRPLLLSPLHRRHCEPRGGRREARRRRCPAGGALSPAAAAGRRAGGKMAVGLGAGLRQRTT